ncbi:MAG TPA: histidine kinase dimerization/phospho-acceptor domain-containing protein [Gaiellaceae bacterium]|jgi:signal transduction histidine kinase
MTESGGPFTNAVSLACHDLRTPLATIAGFAKTVIRAGELPEREARFVGMIDEAATQIGGLVDQLSLAARIAADRYAPVLAEADTLDLASSGEHGISAEGSGATIETDVEVMRRSLAALAIAALRHGELEGVAWMVDGRELTLGRVTASAAPVVEGSSPRDLGALVARMAIEQLGGSLSVEGELLRVRL